MGRIRPGDAFVGVEPFQARAVLEFSNFSYPGGQRNQLGMNAGLVFGWQDQKQRPRYYNVLLTGSEILLERVGFEAPGVRSYEHVTGATLFCVKQNQPAELVLKVDQDQIEVMANGVRVVEHARPTGVVGRVGLRPWRSKMDCTKFVVSAGA